MPQIHAATDIFVDQLQATCSNDRENVQLRYTLDGSDPIAASPLVSGPIPITRSTSLATRAFRDGKPLILKVNRPLAVALQRRRQPQ
jgi:N-acetyl-beta-hexosaminidase